MKKLIQTIKNIIVGYYNKYNTPPNTEVYRRELICYICPVRTDNKCDKSKGGCGCDIKAKINAPTAKCPKNKW